ncbi:MAG: HAD family phosphatase [Coriobacteriales bacterium]|nr:HAD family phosphatase [Coriobacteriales bacterium]
MRPHPPTLWPFGAKAAIFDFDGTLADTAHIWYEVDRAFLSMRGLPYPAEYPQRLSALGFVEGARYTIERFGLAETVEEVCDEWNRMGEELYRDTVTLRPGAQDYIQKLKDHGIPCALATTNNERVLGSMRHVDVASLFDTCVHGDDVGKGKDHPDIYYEAARRLGVHPQDCIVFEDIVPALLSAKAAGATTCAVRAIDPSQQWPDAQDVADLWIEDWHDLAV